MAKAPAFSIIVPVYNVEKYLEPALESLQKQIFSDFEVILVNDGSSDSSGEICERYVKNDHRFQVFHQNNAGVSTARNVGLEKAQGEYIYFFDSDDVLASNALYSWNETFSQRMIDAIFFEAESFSEEMSFDVTKFKYQRKGMGVWLDSSNYIYESILNRSYTPSPCCYVIKRSAIGALKFQPNMIHEDELFYFQMFVLKRQVIFIDKSVYFYRRLRPFSIMTSRKSDKNFNGYKGVFDVLHKEYLSCRDKAIRAPLKIMLLNLQSGMARLAGRIDGYPAGLQKRKVLLKNVFCLTRIGAISPRIFFGSLFPDFYFFQN